MMFKQINAAGGFSPVQALVDTAGRLILAPVGTTPDSTGATTLSPDSLAQVLAYAGPNGAISSITAGPDALGASYRQTFTYTGSNVTGISAWVKQ